jgi:hypothetical protein
MTTAFSEYEVGEFPELSMELEAGAAETAHEGEQEHQEFFSAVANMGSSPALQKLGRAVAHSVLAELESPEFGELEEESSPIRRAYPLGEYGELEVGLEGQWEVSPAQRAYVNSLMEHLASSAAEASQEEEAPEQFLPALIPLATSLLPRLMPSLARVAPGLMRGVTRIGRVIARNPQHRPLMRTLPTVVQRTLASLARQAASGQPISTAQAIRTLARQSAVVIGNPRLSARAYRRGRALDRRFHTRPGGIPIAGHATSCWRCGSRLR